MLGLARIAQAPDAWSIRGSEVSFRIRNAGLTVDGSFTGLRADVRFDPERPADGQITAYVPADSIQTGIALRDRHLRQSDYFDTARHPDIRMVSKALRATGKGAYEGDFELTLKGTTRTVTVPFRFEPRAVRGGGTLRGSFTLNRRDYSIGGSSWLLSDEVTVTLRLEVVPPGT
jgi:polyisoprenoid-binding protein YceI